MIDLSQAQPQQPDAPLIDLNSVDAPASLPAETAQERAKKFVLGLSKVMDKTEESIMFDIQNGREKDLRIEAATALERRESVRRQNVISEIARKREAPITPQELKTIMATDTWFDPETTPEKEYAKYYMQVLERPDTFLSDAYYANPENRKVIDGEKQTGADYITKTELIRKQLEDAEATYSKQSWTGYIVDQIKGIFFPYNQIKTRGNVPGVGYVDGGLWQSSNQREQQRALYRLPLPEFNKALKETADRLRQDNPTLAVAWLNAMLGQSAQQDAIDDFFMGVDAISAPGIGLAAKGVGKGIGLLKSSAREAVKDVTKEAVTNGADMATAKAAAGNVKEAAADLAVNSIQKQLQQIPPSPILDHVNKLPSALRADGQFAALNPASRMAEDGATRLANMFFNASNFLVKSLTDKLNIMRTPNLLDLTKEEVGKLQKFIHEIYPTINNAILDITKPQYDQFTNNFWVETRIGKMNGDLFANRKAAERFAKVNELPNDFGIEKLGNKFYITLKNYIPNNESFVKDGLIRTSNTKSPDSLFSAYFGWLRNPDEILSMHQRLERKNATFGASTLLQVAKESAQAIRDLKKGIVRRDAQGNVVERIWRFGKENKRRWEELSRLIDAGKHMDDPTRPGKKGRWFETPIELESQYQRMFNRLPDQTEIEAYFAHKIITELDWTHRNLLILRNMNRLGVQQHQVSYRLKDGTKVASGWFNGTKLNDMPGTDDALVTVGRNGELKLYDSAAGMTKTATSAWKKLQKEVKEGSKVVIRLWDTEARPLEDFIGNFSVRPRYVIVDAAESKALAWEQLPKTAGGHFEYDYQYYIKQAKIRTEKIGNSIKNWYEGDTTLMPINIGAMGRDIVEQFEKVRLHLKAGDKAAAKKVFDDFAPAGLEWSDVSGWFRKTVVNGIEYPPALDINEPFRLLSANQKIVDIDDSLSGRYKDTFKNGTTTGSDARQLQVQFTGERDSRDLYTITNSGTRQNPVYKYEPVKFVDPLLTMDRSFSKIVNSAYMDDYKIMSVESWLEEAKSILKMDNSEIRAAPFHAFHANSDKSAFKPDADPAKVAQLLQRHWQIRQFMGVRSDTDNLLHSTAQKLADSMYTKYGSVPIDPLWALPLLKDPARFIRGVAFDLKLGMFAVPQFLVQLQTYSVIAGVAGVRNTIPAVAGAMFSRYAMRNSSPEILEHMDKLMTKLKMPGQGSWKPGEWVESNKALQRTGFHNVGGEVALRDDIEGAKLISGTFGNFLDAGRIFFTEGERFSRLGAWHAAYREFRNANPVGKLTDQDIKAILERADTFTVNMSRASSSALHSGFMSIPTQFLTYQIRLAELMWGKRLTAGEKARIIGVSAALYGAPTSLAVSGLPLGDYLRKNAIENGYVVGDNWIESVITEGLPAAFLAMVTGGGDPSKGNWYNVGERFGPGGFDTIREALRGDKSFMEIMGGASYSIAKGIWDGTDGFRQMATSFMRDDPYTLTAADVVDAFKEISSVNQAWKGIAALQTGRWLSKKESYLADVGPASAIFMAATGLQPQGVSDLQLMSWSTKDKAELEKHVGDMFIKQFRRGIRVQTENPDQAKRYFTNAFALLRAGGYPMEKQAALIAKASKDYESMIESMDWSFYGKNAPDAKRNNYLNTYIQKKKLERQQ